MVKEKIVVTETGPGGFVTFTYNQKVNCRTSKRTNSTRNINSATMNVKKSLPRYLGRSGQRLATNVKM